MAAFYFDAGCSAAELDVVARAVDCLVAALDRPEGDEHSAYDPRTALRAAREHAVELLEQLRVDLETDPAQPASRAAVGSAQRLVAQLLEACRLEPQTESYRLYSVAAMSIAAVLVPIEPDDEEAIQETDRR